MSRCLVQPIGQKRLTNVAVVRHKEHGVRFEIAWYKNKILEKGELQVAGKERESQLSSQFWDVATIVMQKAINPETQHPYTIRMIESLMHEIHFAVDPHTSSKKQDWNYVIHGCVNFDHDFSILWRLLHGCLDCKFSKNFRIMVQVCEMGLGLFHDCDALMTNLQKRLEILAVSVHVEGDAHVDRYDGTEDLPSKSTKESDTLVQISERLQKENISRENSSSQEQVKQNRCSTCDAVVGDAKQYREHFKSKWHKHNLKRKTKQLPPLTAEECSTDIEVGDLMVDLKKCSFRVKFRHAHFVS